MVAEYVRVGWTSQGNNNADLVEVIWTAGSEPVSPDTRPMAT
jgi:hypothetical protein